MFNLSPFSGSLFLGEKLSKSMIDTAKACSSTVSICLQVIFDAKALFFMFVNKDFMEAIEIAEEKLDPITKAVMDEAISKNAKLFVQRTAVSLFQKFLELVKSPYFQLLFGQLQVDPPTSSSAKDVEIASSYMSLIDIVPIIENVPRIPLISGLSVLEQRSLNDQPKDTNKKKKKDDLDQPSLSNLLGKPSISSFVDKFSTNWFKNG